MTEMTMQQTTVIKPETAESERRKQFRKYVSSSMITMLLQGTYSVIDGLFVSNFVSSTALSAINVAWPIIAFITAVGTGVGCGGAAIMSMKQGAGDQEGAKRVRGNILYLLFVIGLFATVFFMALLTPLLKLMGAEGELLHEAEIYARVMIGGGLLQVFSCGLTPILRNDNRAVTAMHIMIGGLTVNSSLDLFSLAVLHAGIAGAAVASVTAQGFTTVCCLYILRHKKEDPLTIKEIGFDRDIAKRILFTAISPFGISLTPSFLILEQNVACLHSGDSFAVGSYALIGSTVGSYRILLIGVAEGMQPLASFAHGAHDADGLRWIRRHAIGTAYAISLALFFFTMLTAGVYPLMFGYSGEAATQAIHAVQFTAAQLIFTGMVRVTNSFFYAVGKDIYSMIMIYLDPVLLTPLLLVIFPHFLGTDGIWITPCVAQFILNIIAVVMFVKHDRTLKIPEKSIKILSKADKEESKPILSSVVNS